MLCWRDSRVGHGGQNLVVEGVDSVLCGHIWLSSFFDGFCLPLPVIRKWERPQAALLGALPANNCTPGAKGCFNVPTARQQCLNSFLTNNYESFVGGTVVPDSSLISIAI